MQPRLLRLSAVRLVLSRGIRRDVYDAHNALAHAVLPLLVALATSHRRTHLVAEAEHDGQVGEVGIVMPPGNINYARATVPMTVVDVCYPFQ